MQSPQASCPPTIPVCEGKKCPTWDTCWTTTIPLCTALGETPKKTAPTAGSSLEEAPQENWFIRVNQFQVDVSNDAAVKMIEAECRLVEILDGIERNRGGRPKKTTSGAGGSLQSSLQEAREAIGVSEATHIRWRQGASVPESDRTEWFATVRLASKQITWTTPILSEKNDLEDCHDDDLGKRAIAPSDTPPRPQQATHFVSKPSGLNPGRIIPASTLTAENRHSATVAKSADIPAAEHPAYHCRLPAPPFVDIVSLFIESDTK